MTPLQIWSIIKPKKFEDFLELKYNNKERYGTLKHAYRVANQYESNSGSMEPMKIVELHDEAVACKAKFTGKARKEANIGILEIDGNIYIANSKIDDKDQTFYLNYQGDRTRIVLQTEKPRFHPFVVGSRNAKVDSECKLLEFAATIAKDGEKHNLKMLSERSMCPSCLSVLNEFHEEYPNVSIEVVSHKKEKAEKNRNNNTIFKKDVELRYKNENS